MLLDVEMKTLIVDVVKSWDPDAMAAKTGWGNVGEVFRTQIRNMPKWVDNKNKFIHHLQQYAIFFDCKKIGELVCIVVGLTEFTEFANLYNFFFGQLLIHAPDRFN